MSPQVFARLLVATAVVLLALPDAGARRSRRHRATSVAADAPAVPKLPRHPVLGVPVFAKATEASEKMIRGLGLDAWDGYRVGLFLTNAPARKVAMFYIRALGRTVKKRQGDGSLQYTLMIRKPSGDNPLGEKVVVKETDTGVRDEHGRLFKTSIVVYRKKK